MAGQPLVQRRKVGIFRKRRPGRVVLGRPSSASAASGLAQGAQRWRPARCLLGLRLWAGGECRWLLRRPRSAAFSSRARSCRLGQSLADQA